MSTVYPAWILERSFGGLGTAVSPVSARSEAGWPDGPSSPIAREACAALATACNGGAGPNDPRCMVFLVGGAGNGKSKLAADAVGNVDGTLQGDASEFAQRTYAYELAAGGCLRVINDATIPPADKHVAPLVRDLSDVINSGDHLLACINRGVLISETGITEPKGGTPAMLLASKIANWLLSSVPPESDAEGLRLEIRAETKAVGHYRIAELWRDDIKRAVIHVVYMDQASLLEQWVEAELDSVDYRSPLPVGSIDVTPILSSDRRSNETAFEACLLGAARAYDGCAELDLLDPVGANAASLSRANVARGWCSLMRGAEVISGTHFTYRELWALCAHSVIGPVTSEGLNALSSWVEGHVRAVRTADAENRLSSLLSLGSIRSHMLLFDAGNRVTVRSDEMESYSWPTTESEALRSIRLADPLRNFGPSDGAEAIALTEHLAGIEEGRLPGAELAEMDELVADYWMELDGEIETAIRAELDPGNDMSSLKKRNWLLGWYGRYMYRLVGLARGFPAHCSVVDEWQRAWQDASRQQRLSHELGEAVLDIVATPSGRGAESFFTFMQPRVDAGDGAVERVLVALPRNRFIVRASTEGDRVELRIDQGESGGDLSPTITTLDFHLLREAIARRNGHGFTDSLMLIEPRIERTRASLVAHQLSQPDSLHKFKFSHRGDEIVTR